MRARIAVRRVIQFHSAQRGAIAQLSDERFAFSDALMRLDARERLIEAWVCVEDVRVEREVVIVPLV